MAIHESIEVLPAPIKVYFVQYLPAVSPKGLIILVHGLGEHVRRYDEQMNYFNQHGFVVLSADLVGHGRTEGRRGLWSSMEENYNIIDLMFKKASTSFPGLPVYLYGHSMGGNIAARYSCLKRPSINGLILTGPAIKTPKDLPRFLVNVVMNAPAWIKKIVLSNGLDLKSLCTDEAIVKKYTSDPLVHDRISVGAGATIFDNAYELLSQEWQAPFPVLLMHGGKDRITLPSGTEALKQKWKGQIELKIWPEMLHEIHNEKSKKEVWDYILGWINKSYS